MERPFRSVAPRRPRWNTRQCRWTMRIVCLHWARSSRSVDNVQKILWACCAAGSSTHIAIVIRSPRRRARGTSRGIRGTDVTECSAGSLRPDASELDDLRPFLNVLGDPGPELGGRDCKCIQAEIVIL